MPEAIEHLRELDARWNAAYLAGDVERFSALLDDNFVYFSEQRKTSR